MLPSCFALLDDNSINDAGARLPRSRLYTDYQRTLCCAEGSTFPDLLAQMQDALQQGLYAVVLLSYELGAAQQQIADWPASADVAAATPLAEILLFGQCKLLNADDTADWLARQDAGSDHAAGIAHVRPDIDESRFTADIARIRAYIAAGDTYQVNYTYRLHFDTYGEPLHLYRQLRARQPVPYGALIALPDGRAILSLSPELFVRCVDGELTAQPMKGTAPAVAGDEAENQRRAIQLTQDEKNRAENLMIVDLLRNDLGRVAVNGSVTVPDLFKVTRFGQVLQMTSTITAQLRTDATLTEIMAALYPCGSITGAPKHRTMQIIRELELAPRGIYTGAIGWFETPVEGRQVGDFCLSVPIRTLALAPPQGGVRHGQMGVGAGITYDSNAADEFAECRLKARFLTGLPRQFTLFETIYATHEEGCRYLDLHLQRLQASAAYFDFSWDTSAIRQALAAHCRQLPAAQAHRLRLELSHDGKIKLQSGELKALPAIVKVFIAAHRSDSHDLFLRHKSSVREHYDQAWKEAEQRGGFDMLFFNEHDQLTEGGRSNVFVELDGRWFTPPLSAGALPGVMRSVLLQDAQLNATERQISRAELLRATRLIVCNTLRGAVNAELVNS
ncbi:para-aminobenzoate synthetase/4-amino-4-deoxychorismate lyase [Herbaspirillum sp. Sphag1AN]|uniref:aminodeoxychorismate synthase component I n=1 Tax=unclassified Herbaspirillum TaxID=2624150 RepID=UPI00160C457D|nr:MULTISPECIES: aminodeoxychorismate synthase component I [unclassified Herbaspirillum]MBB3210818.1 para-aminobenzoate synthetase/4-amino-4-deoxychorismate lyase [Herbaspirillum sp. Sphag1AN]MBB3244448.1 para-aminobenzoate synthetase/4-amino-4-deoxychorismate lyase [Herbaspirillum sp. Sphag64]